MLGGFKFDLSSIGFYFWFILLGLLTIIFSIIYRPEYVFLGSCLSLYGMIGIFVDLLLDRIHSRILGIMLTNAEMHKISIGGHIIRFILQVGLVIALVALVNKKYYFI